MSAVPARVADVPASRRTTTVGMVMALSSWTMMFGSLFFAYAILRLKAGEWPPDGVEPLPRALPLVNTLVLLASSALLSMRARSGRLLDGLKAALLLGSLFLVLQLAVWVPLWRTGFTIASGVYGSIFYALTVFHALHVLAGLVALLALVPGTRAGRFVSPAAPRVGASLLFWHFVDAVWVVMFVTVYLL